MKRKPRMLLRPVLLAMMIALLLAGCSSSVRQIKGPLVASAADFQMMRIWQRVQQEARLDASAPAWVERMHWEFGPAGEVRHFWFQVRTRRLKESGEILLQVEGGPSTWIVWTMLENPRPSIPPKPMAEWLFREMDAADFPRSWLLEAGPADYQAVHMELRASGASQTAGASRVFEGGRLRPWSPADTERYGREILPMFQVVNMRKQSENMWASSQIHEYFLPGVPHP